MDLVKLKGDTDCIPHWLLSWGRVCDFSMLHFMGKAVGLGTST